MPSIKEILIGSPLPTKQMKHARLDKIRALAAFSPDALSSIAYANEEIYLGLVVAGGAGLALALPIGIAIAALLAIVAISYYQTISAYPSGGGSYVVAHANLGTMPGLVAGAALLIDYVLTAAVSLTAGVAAVASAFPALWPYRVVLALGLLAVITLANLRGLRETGTLMAIPVYLFLFTYLPMLAYGAVCAATGRVAPPAFSVPAATQPLGVLLVLHAFAAGCTALTGVEAISNGVPAFKPPETKNARRTLLVMALLMGVLFVGSITLTQALGVVAGPDETILSALARRLLGSGPLYILIQAGTMLILAVAANTSFADFPRVAALLAKDGFLPRQLTSLGDRLVFANGIVLLAAGTGALILIFRGDTHALIPLFAVGVFLAFTLSQSGMVVHWWRERGKGWWVKAGLNGLGAVATAVTLLIVGAAKFVDGAWITILLIPILLAFFLRIRGHYRAVASQLSLDGTTPEVQRLSPPRVVVPISGVHRGIFSAISYALSISDHVTALYIEIEPGSGRRVRQQWEEWHLPVPLEVVASPYRSIVGPLLDYLDKTDREHHDGRLAAVVLSDLVPARRWHGLLHNQTALALRSALLFRRRRFGFQPAIIDVPYHLQR